MITTTRYTPWAFYPLELRDGTTDIDCFNQVFEDREYACLDDLTDVNLVIDLGAYVGYSAAYFLSRWPEAELFAVESDMSNYGHLVNNLRHYRERATCGNWAAWSHYTNLAPETNRYRDGREWSKQVRECRDTCTPTVEGVTVRRLHRMSRHDRISLLKIDIEGAEHVLFSDPNCHEWIDKTDCLVIELHDDSRFGKCSELVTATMLGRGFTASTHGELTMFRRIAS